MTGAGRIVLASRSPQRRALLGALGIDFRVVAARIEEGEDPQANALAKAREVAARSGIPTGGGVLGCDTEVIVDGRALGKPADRDHAASMLTSLSGRAHRVVSAVALLTEGDTLEGRAVTSVWVRPLSEATMNWYLDTGEWRERAGGYAIQGAGAALVERIDGEYSTVVGLPMGCLADLLDRAGIAPWQRSPAGRAAAQNRGG